MTPDNRLQKHLEDLERERLRIQTEINSYPSPVPGCDVYFNDLLERRARVCDELSRLGKNGDAHLS